MKYTTRFLSVLMFALLLVTLSACLKMEEFSDDLSSEELADEITHALGGENVYLTDDTGLADSYFTLPESVTDHTVRYVSDTNNINEFGVYHVTKGSAKELEAMLMEKYLELSYLNNREWYDSYIPEETSKLQDAEVRTFGNYVVYAILDPTERNTVFETVERALEKA